MVKNPKLPIRIFLVIIIFLVVVDTEVTATSWVEMEPEDVNQKAAVIVMGTYDFSGEALQSDFVFTGVTFNVKKVYRGEANKKIIAGIDQFDEGWVEDFQNEGGEFLLFLEETEDANFLTPVGGPNGMVQVKEGKVVYPTGIKNDYYAQILQGESKAPDIEESQTIEKKEDLTSLFYVAAVTLFAGIGGIFFYRRSRKA